MSASTVPPGHPGDHAWRMPVWRTLLSLNQVQPEQLEPLNAVAEKGGFFVSHLLAMGVDAEKLLVALSVATRMVRAPRPDVRHPRPELAEGLNLDTCAVLLAVPFNREGGVLHLAFVAPLPDEQLVGLPKHKAFVALETDVREGLAWLRQQANAPRAAAPVAVAPPPAAMAPPPAAAAPLPPGPFDARRPAAWVPGAPAPAAVSQPPSAWSPPPAPAPPPARSQPPAAEAPLPAWLAAPPVGAGAPPPTGASQPPVAWSPAPAAAAPPAGIAAPPTSSAAPLAVAPPPTWSSSPVAAEPPAAGVAGAPDPLRAVAWELPPSAVAPSAAVASQPPPSGSPAPAGASPAAPPPPAWSPAPVAAPPPAAWSPAPVAAPPPAAWSPAPAAAPPPAAWSPAPAAAPPPAAITEPASAWTAAPTNASAPAAPPVPEAFDPSTVEFGAAFDPSSVDFGAAPGAAFDPTLMDLGAPPPGVPAPPETMPVPPPAVAAPATGDLAAPPPERATDAAVPRPSPAATAPSPRPRPVPKKSPLAAAGITETFISPREELLNSVKRLKWPAVALLVALVGLKVISTLIDYSRTEMQAKGDKLGQGLRGAAADAARERMRALQPPPTPTVPEAPPPPLPPEAINAMVDAVTTQMSQLDGYAQREESMPFYRGCQKLARDLKAYAPYAPTMGQMAEASNLAGETGAFCEREYTRPPADEWKALHRKILLALTGDTLR